MGKCAQCGCDLDSNGGYNGYCHNCYSDVWDKGFSTGTEWAYDIGHRDLMSTLNEKLINCEDIKETVHSILYDFDLARWYCDECNYTFLTAGDQEKMKHEEIVEALSKHCPSCGTIGNMQHVFKI